MESEVDIETFIRWTPCDHTLFIFKAHFNVVLPSFPRSPN
jgi:hypothetical protein